MFTIKYKILHFLIMFNSKAFLNWLIIECKLNYGIE